MTDTKPTGPLWTQDEAINYEAARECINDLAGIYMSGVYEALALNPPDTAKATALEALVDKLIAERGALTLKDHRTVERVLSVYGATVRVLRGIDQHSPRL